MGQMYTGKHGQTMENVTNIQCKMRTLLKIHTVENADRHTVENGTDIQWKTWADYGKRDKHTMENADC